MQSEKQVSLQQYRWIVIPIRLSLILITLNLSVWDIHKWECHVCHIKNSILKSAEWNLLASCRSLLSAIVIFLDSVLKVDGTELKWTVQVYTPCYEVAVKLQIIGFDVAM